MSGRPGRSSGNAIEEPEDVLDPSVPIGDDDVESDDDGFGVGGPKTPLKARLIVVGVDVANRGEDEVRELLVHGTDRCAQVIVSDDVDHGVDVGGGPVPVLVDECAARLGIGLVPAGQVVGDQVGHDGIPFATVALLDEQCGRNRTLPSIPSQVMHGDNL